MTRPRNPHMARVFDTVLALAADTTSELYWQGKPRRGASHRVAFWDGYMGITGTSAHRMPDTIAGACWRAGQAFAKTNPGIDATRPTYGAARLTIDPKIVASDERALREQIQRQGPL